MAVQFKFFHIPITQSDEAETELNGFLRSVRALTIHKEFVDKGENSLWCLAVEYVLPSEEKDFRKSENRNKTDYRETLSPEDFTLFVKLRDWRKQAAGLEAVPVYTIFTNEQLAVIAQKRVATLADLKTVDGVGESRVSKYGDAILKIIGMEKTTETGQKA